jgi:hypothetical protein
MRRHALQLTLLLQLKFCFTGGVGRGGNPWSQPLQYDADLNLYRVPFHIWISGAWCSRAALA